LRAFEPADHVFHLFSSFAKWSSDHRTLKRLVEKPLPSLAPTGNGM
jgi:hypothetical protein